ncbi:MAG: RHS repeat domain-containing protein [Anaerolineae bacterium]
MSRDDVRRAIDEASPTPTGPVVLQGGAGTLPTTGIDAAKLQGHPASDFLGPQYLVVAADANLTGERVLTMGNGLQATDGGAGLAYTLSVLLPAASGLTADATGLYLADTVAGDGLTIASKVLSVGAGNGIAVAADAVAVSLKASNPGLVVDGDGLYLGTPGTLSVTTANGVTDAAHAHAVTSSSDPGAAASLLASSVAGYLKLVRFGAGVAPGYPLHGRGAGTQLRLDQDDDNYVDFTVSGTGDLTIAPSGLDIIIPATTTTEASDWASRTVGWGIYRETKHQRSGYADFRYLYADELHVTRFISDMEQALAGGQIIAKSVARLMQDFTVPAVGASADLYVEDLPGTTAAVFADSDWVRVRNISRDGGGLDVADAYGTVTWVSHTDAAAPEPGYQRYTFARPAGDTGSAAAGTVVARGGLAIDYGVSGDGYYEVTTLDSAGSPYAQIATWATHPQTLTVRTRLGQLDGLAGIGDEWGLWAGKDADHYVLLSDQSAIIKGIKQQWISADAGNPVRGELDPAATGTNALFWLGPSGGDHRLTVQADGVVLFGSVPSGNVAGWAHAGDLTKIDGGDIYAGTITAVTGTFTTANLVDNPGWEYAAVWNYTGGAVRYNGNARSGNYCLLAYGSGAAQNAAFSNIIPVRAGGTYYLEIYAFAAGGANRTLGVQVFESDAAGDYIRTDAAITTAAGSYTKRSLLVTLASNAATVTVVPYVGADCELGLVVCFDDVVFREASGMNVLVGTPGGARVEVNNDGIEGYDSTPALQFYLRSSDGRAMFGGGECTLDASGLVLSGNETSYNTYNGIRWLTQADPPGGNEVARLYGGLMATGDKPLLMGLANPNSTYTASNVILRCIGSASTSYATIEALAGNATARTVIAAQGAAGYSAGVSVYAGDTAAEDYVDITTETLVRMRVGPGAWVGIGGTANAQMTQGLTINQGAYDDEILALKSSNIAHGITSLTETDTFGFAKKYGATSGGLYVQGVTEITEALVLSGIGVTDSVQKSTAGRGYVEIYGAKKSGTSYATPGANTNLLMIGDGSNGNAKFLVDIEGDFFYDGAGSAYDDFDDVALCEALDATVGPAGALKRQWDDWTERNRQLLSEAGIVHYNDDSHHFVSGKRLARLHNGAIRQLAAKLERAERALVAMGADPALLGG